MQAYKNFSREVLLTQLCSFEFESKIRGLGSLVWPPQGHREVFASTIKADPTSEIKETHDVDFSKYDLLVCQVFPARKQ